MIHEKLRSGRTAALVRGSIRGVRSFGRWLLKRSGLKENRNGGNRNPGENECSQSPLPIECCVMMDL